jgi:uncharacterized protein RhaS with RHS repeats
VATLRSGCGARVAETGFAYLRARYYDPATGQSSPVTHWWYVEGNPLNGTDPLGLYAWRD